MSNTISSDVNTDSDEGPERSESWGVWGVPPQERSLMYTKDTFRSNIISSFDVNTGPDEGPSEASLGGLGGFPPGKKSHTYEAHVQK
jgi:hypothetical protein